MASTSRQSRRSWVDRLLTLAVAAGVTFFAFRLVAFYIDRAAPPPVPPVADVRLLDLQRVGGVVQFQVDGLKQTNDVLQPGGILLSWRFSDRTIAAAGPLVRGDGATAGAGVRRVAGERFLSSVYTAVVGDTRIVARLTDDAGAQLRLCFIYLAPAAVPLSCWETPYALIPDGPLPAQASVTVPVVTVPESLGH